MVTAESRLSGNIPTIASLLAAAGYQTAAVVNSTWLHKIYQLTRDFDRLLAVQEVLDRSEPNSWVTDQALEWLAELGDERLLLFVHYFDVHSDYRSLPVYERQFVRPYSGEIDGGSWQLRKANLEEEYIHLCQTDFDRNRCTFAYGADGFVVDGSVERLHLDANDIAHMVDLYDASIRQLDTERPPVHTPVFDPLTLSAVVVSLTRVAIVSGVAPAIRAERVSPAEALRAG